MIAKKKYRWVEEIFFPFNKKVNSPSILKIIHFLDGF